MFLPDSSGKVITIMQIKSRKSVNAVFNICFILVFPTHALFVCALYCMHIINTVIFIDFVVENNKYKENTHRERRREGERDLIRLLCFLLFDLQFHFHTQYEDNHQLINIIGFLFIAVTHTHTPQTL